MDVRCAIQDGQEVINKFPGQISVNDKVMKHVIKDVVCLFGIFARPRFSPTNFVPTKLARAYSLSPSISLLVNFPSSTACKKKSLNYFLLRDFYFVA